VDSGHKKGDNTRATALFAPSHNSSHITSKEHQKLEELEEVRLDNNTYEAPSPFGGLQKNHLNVNYQYQLVPPK
jgi:hypothetical protein